MNIDYNEETYAVVEELQDISKGDLCYDVAMKIVFTATMDASADMLGLTGRNLVKL